MDNAHATRTPATRPPAVAPLIGCSAEIEALRQQIVRVARSDAKVLITGESGAGKEIVARHIHAHSSRRSQAFAPVHCAGLPETLLESELFGHVRGGITGADRDSPGQLEAAHLGTVFLDDVGEMTDRVQGLLLRFLETAELQRVGAADGDGRAVDVRVVAATSRDLAACVRRGAFREDLFYRLNVIHIVVPALRDRRDDIPPLVAHFLAHLRPGGVAAPAGVSPEAMRALVEYGWPGNIRELRNAIERAMAGARHPVLQIDDLPPDIRGARRGAWHPQQERRRPIVDELYRRMLERHESFWTAVHAGFIDRDLTRADVRGVVRRGLEDAHGNYKMVTRLFNMASPRDYKRFLSFLRKHDCLVPFKEYR